MNLIAFADGKSDLLSISDKIGIPIWDLYSEVEILLKNKILEVV